MATLTGQKVKDAYQSLLKLETGTLTSSTKVVEDGSGNDSALKISTEAVEVAGTLNISSAPASSSTELTALFLDGATNNIVTRELDSTAFTSSTVSVASPVVISGSDVTLDDPANLSDITSSTYATDDKFLMWDESTSSWKSISYNNLKTALISSTYVSAPELVARVSPAISLTTTSKYLVFANTGSSSTATVQIGDANTVYTLSDVYGSTNDSVTINEEGVYQATLSANLTTTSSNVEVTFYFRINGALQGTSATSIASAGEHFITQTTFSNLSGGDVVSVQAKASASAATLNQYSVFHLRKL
jgi:hypothetical protein